MFVTKIRPRVSETDGVGHINNNFIPVWFEAGREEIFKIFVPNLSFENWKFALVNMNIDYTNQLYYGHEVEIHTWIKKIGNKSFSIYEELFQNSKLCAKGTVTYVNYNFQTQDSEVIPLVIRDKLEEHMIADSIPNPN